MSTIAPTLAAPLRTPGPSRPIVASRHHARRAARPTVRWDRLAALFVALALAAWVLTTMLAGPSIARQPAADPVVVVVQPGDTVWALSSVHAPPGVNVADYVLTVVAHNGVRATALQPGTVLELPQ